jgi:activating signal cointegrator complex subunit 1
VTVIALITISDELKEKATRLLNECKKQVYDLLNTRSLVVKLEGLEYMNDDPRAVDVLYIKVGTKNGEKQRETYLHG